MNPVFKKFHLSTRLVVNLLLLVGFCILLVLSGRESFQTPQEQRSAPKPVQSFEDPCKDDNSYNCYKTALTRYISQEGIKPAISTLASLSDSNSTVNYSCHSLAHDLGRTAYESANGDIGKIFKEGNTTCWSGFFHGALEKAFSKSSDLAATANDLCTAKNGVEGSFLYYQCLHGLGHGLSARFDNEIYEALDICKKLKDSYQQRSCYGGVFMENYAADGINHVMKYTSAQDPITPCNKVEYDQKYPCYQLVSIQILKLNNYNFTQAFTTCEQSEADFVRVCYQSVGRDISGYTAEDPKRSVEYCSQGNAVAEEDCIRAVASDSVYSKSSEKNVQKICDLVKDSLKSSCYGSAGQAINVLYNNLTDKQKACRTFPAEYISTCESELTS